MKKGLRFLSLLFFVQGLLWYSQDSFGQKITLQDATQVFGVPQTHTHTDKCAHTILEAKLEKDLGYFGSKSFFEDWINQKIEKNRKTPQIARIQEGPRVIPVVVHIIHSGSSIGTGTNVPESQILEQIRILNEDFRRLNADANRTPAEFLPVAADSNIEFVLAKQDPNGLPTNGIVRLEGPKTIYNPNDATLIGTLSQWNPEEYLNIWVVPLVQPFIGYASFPISDLPGLNFSPEPAITDGVTIDYRFFGRGGLASSASLGRTATHEVGHYLGLRHIWGDGGCGVDDFVTDTPDQDNSNSICNANPSRFSCGNNNMIQNYMDYTPDACMNIFTKGQVERFNAVLANSPRRVTLVNNRATKDPLLADVDLALRRVVQPTNSVCALTIIPEVEVQNAGSTGLTSGVIELRNNGQLVQTKRATFSLGTGDLTNVSFDPIALTASGNQIEFRIVAANDQPDNVTDNNSLSINPVFQGELTLPYSFDLNTFPGQWVVRNPDQSLTWEKTNITISGQSQQAIFIRHFEYEAVGQYDYLTSPIIDLEKYPNAQLVFEVAHGPFNQPGFRDALIVSVEEDCGDDFDLIDVPYIKSGTRLETAPATQNEYIPTSNDQFRLELVNLSEFKSLGKVRLSIITQNAFGNNIYIRNIRILPREEFKYELRLDNIEVPSPVSIGSHTSEVVLVTNTGNLPVSKFLFSRTTNSNTTQTFVASGTTIIPGEQVSLEINNSTADGKNQLRYSIFEPNFDQNGVIPPVVRRFNIETPTIIEVPWRQKFNNSIELNPWVTVNPENDFQGWTIIPSSNGTSQNNVARMENGLDGNSYWLGSPVFNLTSSRQASVFFDIAAGSVDPNTTLRLLASSNGGEEYEVVWSAKGRELSTVSSGQANPNSAGDYVRKYVNLTEFAGENSKQTRLAFQLEIKGQSNSPIYLDNIELFLNANPEPVIPAEGSSLLYPNPASSFFNLAFNLPSRENVKIQIISATGALVHEVDYPGTLNQTYTFSTELFRPGVYIIQISSNSLRDIKRLIIN